MNTTESHQKKLILRGLENFIEWSKRFQALVDIEDWGTMSGDSLKNHQRKAKKPKDG